MKSSTLLVIAAALLTCTGCDNFKSEPPKADIQALLEPRIPARTKIKTIQLDHAPANDGVLTKFKCILNPTEDLYKEIKWEEAGLSEDEAHLLALGPTIAKLTNPTTQEIEVYGSVRASRVVDRWNYTDLQILSPGFFLGEPRTGWLTDSMIFDSPEYHKYLTEQRAKHKAQVATRIAGLQDIYKANQVFTAQWPGETKVPIEMAIIQADPIPGRLVVSIRNPEVPGSETTFEGTTSAQDPPLASLAQKGDKDKAPISGCRILETTGAKLSLKIRKTGLACVAEWYDNEPRWDTYRKEFVLSPRK